MHNFIIIAYFLIIAILNEQIHQILCPSNLYIKRIWYSKSILTGGDLDIMVPKVIAACNEQIAQQLVDLFKKANTGILNKNLG